MATLPILYTGEQFAIIRKEAGLKPYALAKLADVSQTQITDFENGKNITISTYRRLLNALAKFKGEKEAQQ